MRYRLLAALLLVVALPGCSWFKSWGGDPKPGEPAELVEFEPTVGTDELWSLSVGDGTRRGTQQLRPVYRDGVLYVADYEGELTAVDAMSGNRIWRLKTELPFSGGPGLGASLVIVGTENGEVHAFTPETGTPVWIARVSSEILAAPTEADGIVVVRSIDGRVFGLDARNGRRVWVYDHSVPLLTLRGNANPLIRAGIVYLGYDSGEVVALRLDDGTLVWEQAVVTPEGRSELDRLADVDGQMAIVASDLLVSSFKNRVSSLAADSGRLLWFKDVSSATGVTVLRTHLATSDANGHVWLMDRRNGTTLWKQDALSNRDLTRPAIYGDYVVVGDYDGYLHWIDLETGHFVARDKLGGKGFNGAPLVIGDTLYVYTRKGKLIALRANAAL
ncbi:outer membrane protein assembly factor BamB [Marinihelvus fidelis]|uniref:Outer membrane protein assembly factor BamB n=1 Tax=Marinihelvus fidelis TaxID=2613842 RepID=A0A5N0TAI9_9GAMM|nr:outer membrane protein assembly factor BamB [Marinihelvus fidelis]KAA9132025.1 outer membrane protein assembly factor BamB [Marinihelvus fidelis]